MTDATTTMAARVATEHAWHSLAGEGLLEAARDAMRDGDEDWSLQAWWEDRIEELYPAYVSCPLIAHCGEADWDEVARRVLEAFEGDEGEG